MLFWKRIAGYVWSGLLLLTVSVILVPLRPNTTAVGFLLLLAVFFCAQRFGSGPALLAAVIGTLGYDFLFFPPYYAFNIDDPQDWLAFGVFSITALWTGQLSARAQQQTEEALQAKSESERLYRQLREAFEKSSETEALRRSERLKSALLDAVTHDLRTPLTSIKASITTLLSDLDAPAEERLDSQSWGELLQVINEEADRLNRQIESFVELARVEAGDLSVRPTWRTMEEVAGAAMDRANPLLEKHKVKVDLAERLPLVRVDARAMSELVFTLLDNASKYSPPGSTIWLKTAADGSSMVRLTVSDQGKGIPKEFREKVFEKFFRVDETAKDTVDSNRPVGLGMGLAIAKGIIEAHSGRIWIEDGPNGKGTTFVVVVPVGDEE
jgi:K+-sensing histidine kinase KdpD